MLLRIPGLAGLFLSALMVCCTAEANIITRALSLDGSDLTNVSPGQEFLVTIRAGAINAPQSLLGLLFTIDSGGGGTFHAATIGPGTNGTWGVPGEGQSFRSWSNPGFDNVSFFTESWTNPATIDDSSSRLLGSIILRAGKTPGNYQLTLAYSVTLGGVLLELLPVDANGDEIPGSQTQGLTYSVVPEPSSILLFGVGIAGLAVRRRIR